MSIAARPYPSRQQIAEREEAVICMRAQGMSFKQIGKEFGVSRQMIHQIYKRLMADDAARCQDLDLSEDKA